jgi:hypothetical protein
MSDGGWHVIAQYLRLVRLGNRGEVDTEQGEDSKTAFKLISHRSH